MPYTGIALYIYDFQTLITGGAAVGAALWATRYGRRQMRLMTRDLLINRRKALATRRDEVAKLMQEVRDMQRHLRPWENETVEPEPLWAHSSQQTIGMIIASLGAQQDTSLDGKAVDVSRKHLMKSCELLSSCLYDIHAVESIDFGGFEEPPKAEKHLFVVRAAEAASELEDRLSQVVELGNALDVSFNNRISEIRRGLRKLERFALKR